MRIESVGVSVHSTRMLPPVRLYLMAFDRRLISTCFSRVRSAVTKHGPTKVGKARWMPRFCARGTIIWWHSAKTSGRETGSSERVSRPDSTTARSRISSISPSRNQPAFKICSRLAFWLAVGSGESVSINWAKPRMAFSGERSSWLMFERKSDLARFAFSALVLACSNNRFVSFWTASRCNVLRYT